ncbi:hypothetical protein Tco_0522519 [Tanacetum coccineum]
MVVQAQEEMGEGSAMPTDPHHTPIITQPSSSQPQRKQKSRSPKEKDTQAPQSIIPSDPINIADEAVNEEPKASLGDQEDASKQGREIHDMDADKDITLENVHDAKMFDVNDLDGDEVVVESEVTDKADEKRNIVEEAVDVTDAVTIPVNRLARKKAQQVEEANIAWDEIQAKIDADYQLVERLQAQEQQELTIEEKSTLFVQLLEKRKKHFAAKRAEEKRNRPSTRAQQRSASQEQEELSDVEKATLFVQLLEKRRKHFAAKRAEEKRNRPPTKAQQRSFMCTYLKNMEGWKPKDLNNKSFANIQDLFDKPMKRVNTFVDMDTELVKESSKKTEVEIVQESSSKRAGEALEQESSKKQKVDDDKETKELKQCMEIISDDVTIEATPLSTKSPTIMLKNFDIEDLEVLWSIVKIRFKKTEPVNYMDTFLHLNLKTMFKHHLEDNVWKNQQGLIKVLNWKLYDSCEVHCVTMQNILYYLLVEKMYPLTKHTLHQMFNDANSKLIMSVKWHLSFLDWSRNNLRKAIYLNEVFGSILLVIDEAFNEET